MKQNRQSKPTPQPRPAHPPPAPRAAAAPPPPLPPSAAYGGIVGLLPGFLRNKWLVVAVGACLLAGVTVAAYGPAIQGNFIWDDNDYVQDNLTLRTRQGLHDIWFKYGAIPQYYPLVHTSFWIEYQLGARDEKGSPTPLAFHVNNVILHVINALLFWAVLRRLGLRGAYAAALIFAVHPVMVESAAWITERKNVLSMAFYLGALLAYLHFDPFAQSAGPSAPPRPRNWLFYALAVFLFLCALLSKTVTCTLPVVVFLLMWWKRGWWGQFVAAPLLAPFAYGAMVLLGMVQPSLDHFVLLVVFMAALVLVLWLIRRKVPWVAVATLLPLLAVGGALGGYTVYLEKHHVGAEGLQWNLSLAGHALLAGRIPWFYLGKLLWPADIMFFYPRWLIDPSQRWQYLYPAAALVLIAGLWLLRKRVGRGPLTAVLCFGVTLFPALGFLSVYPMRFSYVADHFQYHASLSIIAAVVGLLAAAAAAGIGFLVRLGREREARWGVMAGLPLAAAGTAVCLASLTWRQAHDYADLETLWKNTISKNEGSWISYNNLACIYMQEANNVYKLNATIGYFQKAVELYDSQKGEEGVAPGDPNRLYDDALLNLGIIHLRKGDTEKANEYFAKGLPLKPKHAKLRNKIGMLFWEAKDSDSALRYFRDAAAVDPNSGDAHNNIGFIYESRNLYYDAVEAYKQAIAVQPNHADAHFNLGRVYRLESPQKAMPEYREALKANPRHVKAMDAVAEALNSQGRFTEALEAARKTLAIDGNMPQSLGVAAATLATDEDANLRDGRQALDYATRLCKITDFSDVMALDVLAAAYAETGQFPKAAEVAQSAIDLATRLGRQDWAEQIRGRQKLFIAGKPLRRQSVR